MSVNRNHNKIYNCFRVSKDNPETTLEEFELIGLNPSTIKKKLSKRFFLKEGEEWKIIRSKEKELKRQEPWK